jgi:anti-sigma regulatory factor (Ser/Thr protein kinase)
MQPALARAELRLPGAPGALRRLAPWVEQFARDGRLDAPLAYTVQLCLEEAVSNAIRHNPQRAAAPAGGVRVRLVSDAVSVTAEITDDGAPFDPLRAAEPKSAADEDPGGLGLHLLRQYCDDLHYRRDGATNRLTLRFPRTAARPA